MAKSKSVIAIVFSDLHLNIWAKFNEDNKRTLDGFRVLSSIIEVCEKLNVPALFCGDLFHKPETMDQDLYCIWQEFYKDMYKSHGRSDLYLISGNHGMKHTSVIGKKPISWENLICDDKIFHSLDYSHINLDLNTKVYGIPYIDHNIGLSSYLKKLDLKGNRNILLLHTDYPGAQDTDGRVVDSVENINMNILNRFDLVLCGHIHKPQRLGKKVYMIGAPIQQRRTDRDCEMGYWKLYSDLSMKFVHLEGFPKFIDVNSEDEIKDDGNYYTVIPQKASIKEVTTHKITKQLSKKKLAHRYMKARGIKDEVKEALLVDVLKKSEEC